MTAKLLELLVDILQDMPELITVIQKDIADLKAGVVTDAQMAAKWADMQSLWSAAKAKWAAAIAS